MRWIPFLCVVLTVGSVLGQDPPREPAAEAVEPAEVSEPKTDSPGKGDSDSKDSDSKDGDSKDGDPKKLGEGLESLDPAKSDRDLLEEAIKGMRLAQERMEGAKTDDETRQLQKQVVQDLDELIKKLQQQLQNPQNQSQSKQNQNQQQQKPLANVQRQKPKPKPRPGELKPQPQPSQPEKSENAGETSESKAERERKEAEEARRRKLNQDVWGHLPARIREQLSNITSDKYLPKYAEYVRQYYDALAEKSRDRK